MTTNHPLPLPTAGERLHRLTLEFSAGELACLAAMAEQIGVIPETLAWSYVVGELQDRTDPSRGVPPWHDLPKPSADGVGQS